MGRMKDIAIAKMADLEGQLEGIDRDLSVIEEEIELALKRREELEQETFADSAGARCLATCRPSKVIKNMWYYVWRGKPKRL